MFWKQHLRATMPASLLMGKPDLGKHTVWWAAQETKDWSPESVRGSSLAWGTIQKKACRTGQKSASWRSTKSMSETYSDLKWKEGQHIHWGYGSTPKTALMFKVCFLGGLIKVCLVVQAGTVARNTNPLLYQIQIFKWSELLHIIQGFSGLLQNMRNNINTVCYSDQAR